MDGLDHLEGRIVQVKVDNAAHPVRTVSSGAITLASGSGITMIGFSYTLSLKTLRPTGNDGVGFEDQPVRYLRPILRLFQSVFPIVNGQTEPIRDSGMFMDAPPNLFSGDAEYRMTAWADLGQINIVDTTPFPIMIDGIFGTVEIGTR